MEKPKKHDFDCNLKLDSILVITIMFGRDKKIFFYLFFDFDSQTALGEWIFDVIRSR